MADFDRRRRQAQVAARRQGTVLPRAQRQDDGCRRDEQRVFVRAGSRIAAVYGFEESPEANGIVLELVEGPTLADSISRGPIPIEEALPIARQIVEAMITAHEKGIIHRDLKPANIKITPGGKVKVLDFGLAKAAIGELQSPTVTVGSTQQGTILGTAAYMSPEQARGHAVDKRTDIWAFGCVLYEMLTGHVAFPGETVSDTIVAILE